MSDVSEANGEARLTLEYLGPEDPRLEEASRLRNEVLVQAFGLAPIVWADDPTAAARLGAYEDGRLVGFACLIDDAGEGIRLRVRQVTVAFDRQRGGVGTAMMRELIDEARRRGVSVLWLASRLPAIGFYERLGFHVAGEVYIDGAVNLPHVQMELDLP